MVKAKLVDLIVEKLTGNKGRAVYELQIPEGKEVTIGRRHDSNIQILKSLPEGVKKVLNKVRERDEKIREAYSRHFMQISRNHCALYTKGDEIYLKDKGLEDKGSKNKTYFGREEIEGLGVDELEELEPGQKINLKNGSVIGLGLHYKLKLIIEDEELKLSPEEK